ncbi:hypothetical protein GCM10025776_26480 [Corallincola platygyrae]
MSLTAKRPVGITVLAMLFATQVYATELTPQQCEEYLLIDEVSLTEQQHKLVTEQCKTRFNSKDGVSQCAYEEGELLRQSLSEQAAVKCK